MKVTYLVKETCEDGIERLRIATLQEWLDIIKLNCTLPPEKKRIFIKDDIPGDNDLDRMFIEVSREQYLPTHCEKQSAYRNRVIQKSLSLLSFDAYLDDNEEMTFHDIIPAGYNLEDHVISNFNMAALRTELEEWRPWASDLLVEYLAGRSKTCTQMIANKYRVSLQTARKYKRQFEKKLIIFLTGVSF